MYYAWLWADGIRPHGMWVMRADGIRPYGVWVMRADGIRPYDGLWLRAGGIRPYGGLWLRADGIRPCGGLCGRILSTRKLIEFAGSVNKPLYAACAYKRVPHYKLFRLIIEAGRNAFASFVYIAPFAAFIHYCCTVL